VEVGVRQLCDIATGLAGAAAGKLARILAKKTLRQPEGESLFADAAMSLKQEARWQSTYPNAFGEPLAQLLMSVKIDDRHVEIWSRVGPGSGALPRAHAGTFSDLRKASP